MKVIFAAGINAISGSCKTKNGTRMIFTHRASDKPGQGRCYLRNSKSCQRTTAPSEKELSNRARFAQACARRDALSEEQLASYEADFKRDKGKYRGKQYICLRGYILARLFHEVQDRPLP